MAEGAPSSTAAALSQHKQALRKEILNRRAAVDRAEHARLSRVITDALRNLPELRQAHRVLAYLSFGTEFDTGPFVSGLLSRGDVLVLPRVDLTRRSLALYRVDDPDLETIPGVWGIREPDPRRCAPADAAELDAVLVPGVAFTASGWRLGYGGGFYDRLICEFTKRPALVAAAFSLQVRAQIPLAPRDQRIDCVVTEYACHLAG